MRRLAALLTGLYPQAWRERYGEEMAALLEDVPLDARALASLVRGALGAHLRGGAPVRLGNSVSAAFACFILFALAGAGFAKETEDHAFALAGRHHPLLGISHAVVLGGSLVAAVAVALGGLPLLAHAALVAWRERRRDLGLLLALPPAAIGAFASLTAVLLALGPAPRGAGKAVVLALWWLAGGACAACCALAPRLVLARVATPPALLARALRMAVVLEAAMIAMTLATATYAVGLGVQARALGGQSGGPLWPTTTLALACAGAGMALASGLAAVTTLRGMRALRRA